MQALLEAMGRNKKKTIFVAFVVVVLAFIWHNTPNRRYQYINTADKDYELDTKTGELWQVYGITKYKVKEQLPEDLVGRRIEIGEKKSTAVEEKTTTAVGEKKSTAIENEFTHVIAKDSVYYKGGPQQAQPPDGTFPAGTKVAVIEEAGSYSLVRSEDGVEAYVAAYAVKAEEDEH